MMRSGRHWRERKATHDIEKVLVARLSILFRVPLVSSSEITVPMRRLWCS